MMRRCILQWRDHAEATQLEIKMLWHHATCDIMTCRRLAWCMLFAHQADAAGGGCRCDGRGGGLTAALLCGIWCAAMLITASHHPPSLQIYHCLMIYPPSLHLIPLPSVLPLSVLFTLGEAATWSSSSSSSSVVVGVISDCRLPPLLSVTIHHFKHFSPSLHPSLALSAFICCCFFLF